MMRKLALFFFLLVVTLSSCEKPKDTRAHDCAQKGPGWRLTPSNSCEEVTHRDVLDGLKFLTNPPRAPCNNVTVVDGIGICEDDWWEQDPFNPVSAEERPILRPFLCSIMSVHIGRFCDDIGDLQFERYWQSRCEVRVFFVHDTRRIGLQASNCSNVHSKFSNLNFRHTLGLHHKFLFHRCKRCFYKTLQSWIDFVQAERFISAFSVSRPIVRRVLVIQEAGMSAVQRSSMGPTVGRSYDGSQTTILAQLRQYMPGITTALDQLIIGFPVTTAALSDSYFLPMAQQGDVGGNIVDAHRMMWPVDQSNGDSSYVFGAFRTWTEKERTGDLRDSTAGLYAPTLGLPLGVSRFHHSFRHVKRMHTSPASPFELAPHMADQSDLEADTFSDAFLLPSYCSVPSTAERVNLVASLRVHLRQRCGTSVSPLAAAARASLAGIVSQSKGATNMGRHRRLDSGDGSGGGGNSLTCSELPYTPIVPCPVQLAGIAAEEFALSSGWCDLTAPEAQVPEIAVESAEQSMGALRSAWTGKHSLGDASGLSVVTDPMRYSIRASASAGFGADVGFSFGRQHRAVLVARERMRSPLLNLAFVILITPGTSATRAVRLFARMYHPAHRYIFVLQAAADQKEPVLDAQGHSTLYSQVRQLVWSELDKATKGALGRFILDDAANAYGSKVQFAKVPPDLQSRGACPTAQLVHALAYLTRNSSTVREVAPTNLPLRLGRVLSCSLRRTILSFPYIAWR